MVEWTNQHGCGSDESKLLCNIVVQYMCQSNGTHDDYPRGNGGSSNDVEERTLYMRDGTSTDTQVAHYLLITDTQVTRQLSQYDV